MLPTATLSPRVENQNFTTTSNHVSNLQSSSPSNNNCHPQEAQQKEQNYFQFRSAGFERTEYCLARASVFIGKQTYPLSQHPARFYFSQRKSTMHQPGNNQEYSRHRDAAYHDLIKVSACLSSSQESFLAFSFSLRRAATINSIFLATHKSLDEMRMNTPDIGTLRSVEGQQLS